MRTANNDNFIRDYKRNKPIALIKECYVFFFYGLFFTVSFVPGAFFLAMMACLVVTYWAAHGNPFDLSMVKRYKLTWLVLYFAVHALWLANTENLRQGVSDIERHLSFLVFPLMLPAILAKVGFRRTVLGYRFYILGCFVVSSIAILVGIVKTFREGAAGSGTAALALNHDLLAFLNLHATYFSLNILIAGLLIGYLSSLPSFNRHDRWLAILFIAVFLISLYLLRARIILISMLITVPFMVFWLTGKRAKRLLFSLMMLFVLLFAAAFAFDSSFKERLREVLEFDFNHLMGTNAENGVTQRVFLWQRASESIKESPWLGHGTGDMYEAIRERVSIYLDNDGLSDSERQAIDPFLKIPYNPHNQMLVDLMKFGITGLAVLLAIFWNGYVMSFRHRSMLMFGLTTLFGIACLTEAMLVRQKGADLFCLCYTVFAFWTLEKAQNKT